MRLTTVATKEVEAGLRRAVASLRHHGSHETVFAYVPDGYVPPDCDGIEIVPCANWWRGMPGVEGERHNAPALAKPSILLDSRWRDGERVLCFDSADVLFFCDPEKPFRIQTNPLMAYSFERRRIVPPLGGKMDEAPYFNNGVWSFVAGDEARRFGHVFAAMCMAGVCRDVWPTQKSRPIVGDQEAFNAAACVMPEIIQQMPHEMNYRGGTNVARMRIEKGRPFSRNSLPVLIAHATGGKPIARHIVELATGSTEPIYSGGPMPSVSVIVPAHKAAAFLPRVLESIEAQTVKPLEILVGIDACGETLNAARLLTKRADMKYIPEHAGPYLIRNTLAERARGDVLCFFDADDEMDADYIADCMRLLKPGAAVYGCSRWVSGGREVKKKHVPHGAFFIHRDEFMKLGGFEGWLCAADTDFMTRLELSGMRRIKQDAPRFTRHKHDGNLTVREETRPGSRMRNDYEREIERRKAEGVRAIRLRTVIYHNVEGM